jgi:hypothetical protein
MTMLNKSRKKRDEHIVKTISSAANFSYYSATLLGDQEDYDYSDFEHGDLRQFPGLKKLFDEALVPSVDKDAYIRKQRDLFDLTYGNSSIYARSADEFLQYIYNDGSIWGKFSEAFEVYHHYSKLCLSNKQIQNDMDFYSNRHNLELKSWKSIKTGVENKLSAIISYQSIIISYPYAWGIEKKHNVPEVEIRCRDPIECIQFRYG